MYIQHGWLWSLTQLYNGERRSKSDMVFHALGHQDELNAVLGVVREHCNAANNGLNDMSV
jgi:cob(I)alamin adenosyltransferase